MADFNVNLAAPQGAGAGVVAPAAPPSVYQADGVTPWVALGANLTGILSQNLKENEAKQKEQMKQTVISDFTQQQTAIANAVERGMPKSQAMLKARSNFSQFSANYPSLIGDFKSSNSAILENTGLGVAKSEVEMFQDMRKQTLNSMIKEGYPISESSSPATIESWVGTFQKTKQQEANMDRMIKQSSFVNSQNSEERAQYQFNLKNQIGATLTEVGGAHLESAQLFVQDSMLKAKAGDVEGAKIDITNYFSTIQGKLAAASAHDPSMASNWNRMFDDLKKTAFEGIDGKSTAESLDNQLKIVKNKAQMMALSNPQMQGVYALSALTNGTLASTYVGANKTALDTMTLFGVNPLSDTNKTGVPVVGNKEIDRDFYAALKDQVKVLESGKSANPEETKKQIGNVMGHILKQTSSALDNGMTSKDLSETAKFFASPEYAKVVTSGAIDKQQAGTAKRVFEIVYQKDVVNGIKSELQTPFQLTGRKDISYGDVIDFQFAGSGVGVVGAYDKYLNPMEKQNKDQVVREMGVATAGINQLIHIGAHMEGHTNYEKYWEENKHQILPNVYPDPNKLKVGQTVQGKDGNSYKYVGGNYNNIERSYIRVGSKESE